MMLLQFGLPFCRFGKLQGAFSSQIKRRLPLRQSNCVKAAASKRHPYAAPAPSGA
jgi:hypothetical protein